ncbi:hypothetical protein DPMN_022780 [Dreissena polymorpha]|uniref:Uncharacterized protein n=2 Tax=Dreissena polymorpha TaxID=45954 RepID=A0A9D4SC13_DREPO|nr:hypothetical protein DPMN_022780 [Dreissena polymorpha]
MDSSKIASLFILFGLSILSGTLSILMVKCLINKFENSGKLKRTVSLMNCFSGGVFFGVSLLNLLPEAREAMENALEHYNYHTEYPLTELLLCVGLFLILAIEHFSHMCCSPKKKLQEKSPILGSTSNAVKPQAPHKEEKEKNKIQCNGIGHSADVKDKGNEILVHSEFEDSSYADDLTYHTYGTVDESLDKSGINPFAGSGLSRDGTPFQTEVVFYNSDRIIIRNKASPEVDVKPSTHDAIRSALDIDADDIRRLKIRGIVLMVALSLHMIFDGLAIGLMTKSSKVWQLLGAVALHKCLVFFTIGLQSLEILASAKKAVFVIVFLAIISPIGILIGEAINSSDDVTARETVSAVLQGIATGTFLFVTFFRDSISGIGRTRSRIAENYV